MSQTPWFENGLRFHCTQCGNCCTGAPGYVWVNQAEIKALASRLEMDVIAFEQRYVRQIGIRKSLVEYPNGDCVFFDNHSRQCGVYSDRPRQCRTWPFWSSNIHTKETWQRTCDDCPGACKGTLYRRDQIEQQAKVLRI